MRYEPLTIRSAALCLAVMLASGCVTGNAGPRPDDAQSSSVLKECELNLERLRQNNALLIETNAKLTTQLQSGKLDQVTESGDHRVRLSECEFRVRELEDSVSERETRIAEFETEIDRYSADLSAALEDKRIAEERLQADEFTKRLGEEKYVLLYDEFAVEFASELEAGTVSLSRPSGKVVFTVQNQLVFKPGTVEVTEKGRSILKRVAGTVRNLRSWEVMVRAHTDNSKPGKALSKSHPTNWEISLARANAVVRHMAERESIDPSMLSAAGYSEHRPLDDNDTPEGRERNLRVEFVFEQAAAPNSAEGFDEQ